MVFDLDGTLSDHSHRRHLVEGTPRRWSEFWERCSEDVPIALTIDLARSLIKDGCRVEIWTGRSEGVSDETQEWLECHGVAFHKLLMRPTGNYLPANDLKAWWLEGLDEYPVLAVDDRRICADWWMHNGVPCLLVESA